MSGHVLRVDGLRRTFDGVTAVDGISFVLGEGEVVSIIGPNGSGKTTTLNLVSGLLRAEAGTIELGGRRIERAAPEEIAEVGLGRTFQNGRVFGGLTVAGGRPPRRSTGSCGGPPSGSRRATTSSPTGSPTPTGGAPRSPARSRHTPGCCCSTSPPRG